MFVIFGFVILTGMHYGTCAFCISHRSKCMIGWNSAAFRSSEFDFVHNRGSSGQSLSKLFEGSNEISNDEIASTIVDASTTYLSDTDTPDEFDKERQAKMYKSYQELLSQIMQTSLWRRYSTSLNMKSIVIKSFYSMLGFFFGDLLAQIIFKKGSFNFVRFLRMGAFGGLIHGPSGHFLYGLLDRKFPGSSTSAVIKKVCVDQIFWCPLFVVILFCFKGITSGFSLREMITILKISGPQVIFSSWLIWPAAHAINFRVIPTNQRLFYINTIQLFFNTILSALVNST